MERAEYGGGRPAPTPIFNHRKRQRQAVFADPGLTTTPNSAVPTAAAQRYADLMPVGGFQSGRQQFYNKTSDSYTPAQKQKCSGSSSDDKGMSLPYAGRTSLIAPSTSHVQETRRNPANFRSQQDTKISSRGNYANRKNNTTETNSSSTFTYQNQSNLQSNQHQQTQQRSNSNLQRSVNQFGGGQTNVSFKRGYSQQNNCGNYTSTNTNRSVVGNLNMQTLGYGNNSNNNQFLNRGHGFNAQSSMAQNREYDHGNKSFNNSHHNVSSKVVTYTGWGDAPTMSSSAPAGVPGQLLNITTGGQCGFAGQSSGQNVNCTSVSSSRNSSESVPQRQRTKQFDKKTKMTPSLKVLTANLASVLKLTFFSDQLGPHLFEVFGVLDSAVVTDKTGTGKEFILRDETSTLQCVFYEIDRQLSRLIRGQWQRCVGTMDCKTNRLKCVSVRAVKGDERLLVKVNEEQSEKLLTSLRRSAIEQ